MLEQAVLLPVQCLSSASTQITKCQSRRYCYQFSVLVRLPRRSQNARAGGIATSLVSQFGLHADHKMLEQAVLLPVQCLSSASTQITKCQSRRYCYQFSVLVRLPRRSQNARSGGIATSLVSQFGFHADHKMLEQAVLLLVQCLRSASTQITKCQSRRYCYQFSVLVRPPRRSQNAKAGGIATSLVSQFGLHADLKIRVFWFKLLQKGRVFLKRLFFNKNILLGKEKNVS